MKLTMKCFVTALSLFLGSSAFAQAQKILVYNFTEVEYSFDRFQQATGITVEVDHSDSNLLWTKLNDSQNPARPDILLFDDITEISQYAQKGWFGHLQSAVLNQNIPANFRSLNAGWVGLSFRARTMVYNPSLVNPADLSTYEDLADPKWKGRLCLRKGTYKYSQALTSGMMLADGAINSEITVRGWVSNNTQPIFVGDQPLVQALESGQCGVALVNTQYLAVYKSTTPNSRLQLFWANQQDRGVHVNITGAGLFYQAPNPVLATRFLEFMVSDQTAAANFADAKSEYPVNLHLQATNPLVLGFGGFKFDPVSLGRLGANEENALSLNIRAGYSP